MPAAASWSMMIWRRASLQPEAAVLGSRTSMAAAACPVRRRERQPAFRSGRRSVRRAAGSAEPTRSSARAPPRDRPPAASSLARAPSMQSATSSSTSLDSGRIRSSDCRTATLRPSSARDLLSQLADRDRPPVTQIELAPGRGLGLGDHDESANRVADIRQVAARSEIPEHDRIRPREHLGDDRRDDRARRLTRAVGVERPRRSTTGTPKERWKRVANWSAAIFVAAYGDCGAADAPR